MGNLVSKIIAVDVYISDAGTDFENEERYGYLVFDTHPLAELKGESLHLGSYVVKGYDNEFEQMIPALYCVRTLVNGYNRFICGLDLAKDGRVWVGIGTDSYFASIDEAMNFVQGHEGKECFIVTEEKMPI